MPFLPKGFEWVIILIVVLIIFGPKNLPKLFKGIKRGLNGLKGKGKAAQVREAEKTPASEEFAAEVVEVAEEQPVAAQSVAAASPLYAQEPVGDVQAYASDYAAAANQAAPRTVKRKVVMKKVEE